MPTDVKPLAAIKQDNNLVLKASAAISAATNGNALDFGIAGGCPEGCMVVKVSGLPTSKTLTVELRESDDKFVGNDTDTLLHLQAIAADGTYFLPVNNRVVRKRSFRPKFVPNSFTTGQTVTVEAWMDIDCC